MPRLFNKKFIKGRLVYSWYFFLIIGLVLPFLWIWAFSMFHQPLPYQKLHTFFSGSLEDATIGVKVQDKIGSKKIRSYEFQAITPGTISFEERFTTIGLNISDILIIEKETADRVKMSDFFVTLDDYLLTTYFPSSTELYTKDGINYGVKFNKNSWTKKYITYSENKDYYMFINKASNCIGKYREGQDPSHTLAFEVANLYLSETI